MDPGLDLGKSAADQHAAVPALFFPSDQSRDRAPSVASAKEGEAAPESIFHPESSIEYPASTIHHPPNPQSAIRNPQSEISEARVDGSQQLLFAPTPQDLCAEIGLLWRIALKLYEDGWLSFSPQSAPGLNQAQEAELRFIGSLVLAGCDGSMLAHLLSGLARPYAYDSSRLYFNWLDRRWCLLPTQQANPEAAFADWLDRLVASQEIATIAGIGELARNALARIRAAKSQQQLYSDHRHVTRDGEQMQG